MSKKLTLALAAVAAAIVAALAWQRHAANADDGAFISSNGRIEATEVDVATKLPGRLDKILVEEGAFVKAGEVLATMQVQTLDAQLREARAQRQQAVNAVASAKAQVAMRLSDKAATVAQVRSGEAELEAARRRLQRTEALLRESAVPAQTQDDDRASLRTREANVTAAQARVVSAEAAIDAARVQVTSAQSQVEAVDATLERIQAEIDDSQLKAPRDGRVQFRVAQPGEVLGAGGKVLNLIDLTDVYMSFFLPTEAAGRIAMGAEVRLVLDAAPDRPIPARISYVSSVAQFTPKTVETASERQKLMFRVRAQIDREVLERYRDYVKTGVPGVAWVRLDPARDWPAHLAVQERP